MEKNLDANEIHAEMGKLLMLQIHVSEMNMIRKHDKVIESCRLTKHIQSAHSLVEIGSNNK